MLTVNFNGGEVLDGTDCDGEFDGDVSVVAYSADCEPNFASGNKRKRRRSNVDPKILPDEEDLDDNVRWFEDHERLPGDPQNVAIFTDETNQRSVGLNFAVQELSLISVDDINQMLDDVNPEEVFHSSHSSSEENEWNEPSSNEFQSFVYETDDLYTLEESENQRMTSMNVIELELEKGQVWNTVNECRVYLRKYAIAKKFQIDFDKNDSDRIRGICKEPNCPWIVNIRRCKDNITMKLKKFNDKHTCSRNADSKNSMCDAPFIAEVLEDVIKTHYLTFKPKDIINQVWKNLQVKVSYHVAWKARDLVLEKMFGSYEDSYPLLPELCRQISLTNPGSIAFCTRDDSTKAFTGLCIAFRASLNGFLKGCRPIIGLDGCFLKGKFGGICLSMNALDGNNGLFPIAIYVCNLECYDNWFKFLNALKPHIEKHADPLTFISDRQKGLVEAVSTLFPRNDHRFCFKHMYQNFKKEFIGKELELNSWGAAKAYKKSEHTGYLETLKVSNKNAFIWLQKVDKEQWCRSFFENTSKCEHVSNNFSESFNNWIGKLRDRPICNFVEKYQLLLMTCLYERRKKGRTWDANGLVPRAIQIIDVSMNTDIFRYTLAGSDFTTFSVMDLILEERETVDIKKMSCTCRKWDLNGIPCVHAVLAVKSLRRPWTEWCSKYHSVTAYRDAYEDSIKPLSSVKDWDKPQNEVLPPIYRRGVGRPVKNRRRGDDEVRKEPIGRQKTCSRCGQRGHNRKSCKGPILPRGNTAGNTIPTPRTPTIGNTIRTPRVPIRHVQTNATTNVEGRSSNPFIRDDTTMENSRGRGRAGGRGSGRSTRGMGEFVRGRGHSNRGRGQSTRGRGQYEPYSSSSQVAQSMSQSFPFSSQGAPTSSSQPTRVTTVRWFGGTL